LVPDVKEEYKQKMFENRVLRRIFRPMRDGIPGGQRKLHNVYLHKSYSLPDIRVMMTTSMRLAGHVA
jgi:hypothetical protein